jgi:type II secretory ATPase GspE/PulE/Tfp pilus assembly ATPase PilB-like protein
LGFKGRTGVFELWRLDEEDYQMILRDSDEHRLRAWLQERGHRFLISEALELLDQGVTTFGEVRRVSAGTVGGGGMSGQRGVVKAMVNGLEISEVV